VYSIQIPALHGKYLHEVLESIRSQTFQDYEAVVVNSGSDEISDIIRSFGFKEIKKKVKTLEARYIANLESKGEYALLLDETKPLRNDALSVLSSNLHDMVIIGEKQIGSSIWIRLAQLDKDNIMYCNAPEPIKGFALPRLFKREILTVAMERLKNALGDTFDELVYPDHELIYYEAFKISNDVFFLKEKLIYHYGDKSINEIVKKYYRYGKSLKVLKNTPYSFMTSLGRKRRIICKGTLIDKLLLNSLYIVRGIPFMLGYLFS